MNASDQNPAAVRPNAEKRDWFTMPLRRDPGISVSAEQDAEWEITDKTAQVFVGIIRHDDALEMVVFRKCDHTQARFHHYKWPMQYHKRWRWNERQGLHFGSDYTITIEEQFRIEQAIRRKVSVLADPEHPKVVRQSYLNIPWKSGGAKRTGASCSGLVWLWLAEQMGMQLDAPTLPATTSMEIPNMPVFKPTWQRGDVVFFRYRDTGKIQHCAVCIGENKLLHIVQGFCSRTDNGIALIQRLGFDLVGALSPEDAKAFYTEIERFQAKLTHPAKSV